MDVNGETIIFEPDEECNYRAMVDNDNLNDIRKLDMKLIGEITDLIEGLVK